MNVLQRAEKIEREILSLDMKRDIYRVLISGLNGKFSILDHQSRFRINQPDASRDLNLALSNFIIVNLGTPQDEVMYTEYKLTKKGYRIAAQIFDIKVNG